MLCGSMFLPWLMGVIRNPVMSEDCFISFLVVLSQASVFSCKSWWELSQRLEGIPLQISGARFLPLHSVSLLNPQTLLSPQFCDTDSVQVSSPCWEHLQGSPHLFPSLGSLSCTTSCSKSENWCYIYFGLFFKLRWEGESCLAVIIKYYSLPLICVGYKTFLCILLATGAWTFVACMCSINRLKFSLDICVSTTLCGP